MPDKENTEILNFCPYTWKTRNFPCLKNREFLRKSGSFESKKFSSLPISGRGARNW